MTRLRFNLLRGIVRPHKDGFTGLGTRGDRGIAPQPFAGIRHGKVGIQHTIRFSNVGLHETIYFPGSFAIEIYGHADPNVRIVVDMVAVYPSTTRYMR